MAPFVLRGCRELMTSYPNVLTGYECLPMRWGESPLVFSQAPSRLYAAVAGLMPLIGSLATLPPALRAAYVDPLTASRQE